MAIIDARNIDKKVPIYYHIQENMPPYLVGDVVRIKQVMLNYASNAIKYTSSGRIDVTIRCNIYEDNHHEKNRHAILTFTVQDTGQGIRKEDLGKLFIMYGQVDSKKNYGKEGTGIGLAISKYFIEEMGGNVRVESTYGKGSTFSFILPQKLGQGTSEEFSKDAGNSSFVAKNARILLVDDNDINREVVKAMLEPMEFTIDEACNGQEAVEMALKTSSSYALILMDSHMPVMSGEEATIQIRQAEAKSGTHTPIIALTADAISGVKERLLESGMDDYIEKPIDSGILLKTLEKYLDKF